MAQKCVHKGCGKVYTDENEECVYHPGPPEFHEGHKGTCADVGLPSTLTDPNYRLEVLQTAGSHV